MARLPSLLAASYTLDRKGRLALRLLILLAAGALFMIPTTIARADGAEPPPVGVPAVVDPGSGPSVDPGAGPVVAPQTGDPGTAVSTDPTPDDPTTIADPGTAASADSTAPTLSDPAGAASDDPSTAVDPGAGPVVAPQTGDPGTAVSTDPTPDDPTTITDPGTAASADSTAPTLSDPAVAASADPSTAIDPDQLLSGELSVDADPALPQDLAPSAPTLDPSTEAGEAITGSDPYFTREGTVYSFTTTDCDPLTPGDQPCSDPIQAALDNIRDHGMPDDLTLYVQGGSYSDNLLIDGSTFVDQSKPLTISGSVDGSDSVLNGTVAISNFSTAVTLDNINLTRPITITDISSLTLRGTEADNLFDVHLQGDTPLTLTVEGGGGSDSLTVTGDDGNNDLNLSVTDVATVNVDMGDGDDRVTIAQASLTSGTQILSVDGGAGSDLLGLHAAVTGIHNIETLDVLGYFQVANSFDGDVVLDKKTDQLIVLSDGSTVTADLQTLGIQNASFLIGYNGIGLHLDGVNLAIAWWTEKVSSGTARKWTSVMGTVGDASFDVIPGLGLSITSGSILVNKAATDGMVVDYTSATDLTVTVGSGATVTFEIDGSRGDFVQVGGNANINLFGLASVTADFDVEMRGARDIVLSDRSTVAASLLTIGLTNLNLFVGYTGIGLHLDDVDLVIARWTEKVSSGTARTWTSVMGDVGTATFAGISGLTLLIGSVEIEINKKDSDETVVDYVKDGSEMAIAWWTEEVASGTARTWTSVMGDVGSATFAGISWLTLIIGSAEIEINKEASDGTVVDYVKDGFETSATDLSVVVGPGKTVTFAIDDDLGDVISVQVGSATLGVDGLFYISGSFAFVKRTDTVTVITGLTAVKVKDNAALKDGLGHVTGVSEDYSQITDMPVDALLLGGSNVTISVGGAPDEALFSIKNISFGLGLFSSQESGVVPTLYALYARKDITHVPGQHDLDLGLLMIDLDAIIFRLNGGGTWTGTTASAYIDFAGNTVDVPTGGTPVTLAYSTAVIGVELINPVLNVADFVVISADSLLIEHRTGQVDVVTGLTSSTVGNAKDGLDQIKNATVKSGYSRITNLRANINVFAATNVNIYIGGTSSADALISLGPISFGLALVTSTKQDDPARVVPTMVALDANWTDPLDIDYEGLTIKLGGLIVKVNSGSSWKTGKPNPPAPFVNWTTSPSFSADGGMNLTTDGKLKADFDHGLIRVEADNALVNLFDFFYLKFDTFFIEKGSGWALNGSTGLNLVSATLLGLDVKLASLVTKGIVSSDLTSFTGLALNSLLLGGTGIQLFVGYGPYFVDSNGDGKIDDTDTPIAGAVGFVVSGLDFGLAILHDPSKVFPTMFALKGTATGVKVVGLPFLTLSASAISVELNIGNKWNTSYDYQPSINWVTSFPDDGGYQITSSIKLDFTRQAIRLAITDGKINILDVLYLQGSFAFEKGARYTVQIKNDTGLVPSPITTDVDVITLGGRNLSAFFGIGSMGDDGQPTDGSVGLSIQNLTFGLGLFKLTNLSFLPAQFQDRAHFHCPECFRGYGRFCRAGVHRHGRYLERDPATEHPDCEH